MELGIEISLDYLGVRPISLELFLSALDSRLWKISVKDIFGI